LAAFLLGAGLAAVAWRDSASAANVLLGPALAVEVLLLGLAALIAAAVAPSPLGFASRAELTSARPGWR
jgi:hypothetical protein